jgi:hypothetical protein
MAETEISVFPVCKGKELHFKLQKGNLSWQLVAFNLSSFTFRGRQVYADFYSYQFIFRLVIQCFKRVGW